MDYSVVILTFNSERYIRQCLDSLAASFKTLESEYEILVMDNGSVDGTRALLEAFAEEGQPIDITWYEENQGTTKSRNHGLRRARGKYIIVLDSDAYVNPEAIGGLAEYLRSNPDAGMVVPKLTYPDGRFQISTDVFPTLYHKFKRALLLKKMEASDRHNNQTTVRSVDYAISAFWMFRRSLLDEVGLLDEAIFYSPEDVDFCIRVWLAGESIIYLPDLSVVHDAQEISRAKGIKINRFTLSHLKGLLYLFFKHRYGIFSDRSLRRRIRAVSGVQSRESLT